MNAVGFITTKNVYKNKISINMLISFLASTGIIHFRFGMPFWRFRLYICFYFTILFYYLRCKNFFFVEISFVSGDTMILIGNTIFGCRNYLWRRKYCQTHVEYCRRHGEHSVYTFTCDTALMKCKHTETWTMSWFSIISGICS